MSIRRVKFVPGEYYHLYHRGNRKQEIFTNDKDYARFLFLILGFQSPVSFSNTSRQAKQFVQHRVLDTKKEKLVEMIQARYVTLVNFALMPNHFHLTVQEIDEGGISRYMQRVLNAYTKYFNTRHEISGHLFQGPFQAVHIGDNDQLLYLSAYIHRNPREIKGWRGREHEFPWSSYQDYVKKNRWGEFLKRDIIVRQFPSGKTYRDYVEHSDAKDFLNEKSDLIT